MHRVSSLLPLWDRSENKTAKIPAALDKVLGWSAATRRRNSATATTAPTAPVSYVRETYWPQSIDKECEKAARILKSFCTDGFLAEDSDAAQPSDPTAPAAALVTKTIPPRIIQNAYGLAIFSCMRSGLWQSGSGGSGILIARKADGTWSPPAGILMQAAVLAFVAGVDIYDCVLVINSVAVLELFTRSRVVLGSDVKLAVGPLATPTTLNQNIRWQEFENSILTYLKARGRHQGVPLNGCLVQERGNENHKFYHDQVSALDILAGNVPKSIPETRPLFEVIKAAEGRTDYDKELLQVLSRQPAPGDAVIEALNAPDSPLTSPSHSIFGIPCRQDPDPFGVVALEMAGLEIREAGSRGRPTSSQFEYSPSPTSSSFPRCKRESIDTCLSKSNRGSTMSSRTQATVMTDACTQTDTGCSHAASDDGQDSFSSRLPVVLEPEEPDYTKIDMRAVEQFSRPSSNEPEDTREELVVPLVLDLETQSTQLEYTGPKDEHDFDADDEDEEDAEEAVVYEVATTAQPQRAAILSPRGAQAIQAKGALVTIPKRVPPPLPSRSPARTSLLSKSEYGDVSSLRSPLRTSLQPEDVNAEEETRSSDNMDTVVQSETPRRSPSPSVRAHRKTSSMASNAERWSTPHSPLSQPNMTEPTSSGEESEREPQTPVPEQHHYFSADVEQSHDKDTTMPHRAESQSIAVA